MKEWNRKRLCENIDRIARRDWENHKVFGSAYLVNVGGREVVRCFGTRTMEGEEAVTDGTLFRLASMTKPITAVGALILADRGLLSLDDTVDRYLPAFGSIKIRDVNGNVTEPVRLPTLRSLLTHTSGIGCVREKMTDMTAADKRTLDTAVAYYRRNGLDFEPDTAQMYSATASFDVMATIIETVTGMDYGSYLAKEIFEPCGMEDTTFTPTPAQRMRMAAMHYRENGANVECPMPEGCVFEDYPVTYTVAGGGLVSTLRDYGNFAALLRNRGKTAAGQRILSEAAVIEMGTPQVKESVMPGNQRWGLGVRVITEDSYPALPVGAFGWSGAYGSHFWIDPVHELYAVFLKNSKTDGGAGNESAVAFEEAVYASFTD